jgi:hypothetical protein
MSPCAGKATPARWEKSDAREPRAQDPIYNTRRRAFHAVAPCAAAHDALRATGVDALKKNRAAKPPDLLRRCIAMPD